MLKYVKVYSPEFHANGAFQLVIQSDVNKFVARGWLAEMPEKPKVVKKEEPKPISQDDQTLALIAEPKKNSRRRKSE